MAYILSQILGLVVFIFVFASMQTQNMKRVLLCQIGCNGLGMISYVLLGGFSGCGIYLIATIQSVLFYFIRKREKEIPRWLYVIIIGLYIGCSVVSFKDLLDLVPMVAAILCAVSLFQKKSTNYRIIMLLNGTTWSIYDVVIGAYTMLASHILTVVFALWGIIRLDIIHKQKEGTGSK